MNTFFNKLGKLSKCCKVSSFCGFQTLRKGCITIALVSIVIAVMNILVSRVVFTVPDLYYMAAVYSCAGISILFSGLTILFAFILYAGSRETVLVFLGDSPSDSSTSHKGDSERTSEEDIDDDVHHRPHQGPSRQLFSVPEEEEDQQDVLGFFLEDVDRGVRHPKPKLKLIHAWLIYACVYIVYNIILFIALLIYVSVHGDEVRSGHLGWAIWDTMISIVSAAIMVYCVVIVNSFRMELVGDEDEGDKAKDGNKKEDEKQKGNKK